MYPLRPSMMRFSRVTLHEPTLHPATADSEVDGCSLHSASITITGPKPVAERTRDGQLCPQVLGPQNLITSAC